MTKKTAKPKPAKKTAGDPATSAPTSTTAAAEEPATPAPVKMGRKGWMTPDSEAG